MIIIGFTGTRQGMTRLQRQLVESLLVMHPPKETHHGDCVGSDAQFHKIICDQTTASIIIHPPLDRKHRAFCTIDESRGDKVLPEKEYLERNRDIVNVSKIIIAAPKELLEQQRSGTWYTIRQAREKKREIFIVFPDGTVEHEEYLCALCGLPREFCVCEYPFLERDAETGGVVPRSQGEAFIPGRRRRDTKW